MAVIRGEAIINHVPLALHIIMLRLVNYLEEHPKLEFTIFAS